MSLASLAPPAPARATSPTSSPRGTALAHRTLAAAIATELRGAILSGERAAGTALRQDALAAAYGVSRIPVREALIQLEAEGLVRIAPHRGAVVSAFEADEVDDVFELRALLEPRLLRRSAPRLQAADFAALAALERDFDDAIARHDVARWGELNARFHAALYRHAALPRTAAVVQGLLQASDRCTRVQLQRQNALARARREHARLLALCRSGDVDAACALLVRHVEGVRRDLQRLMRAPPAGRSR